MYIESENRHQLCILLLLTAVRKTKERNLTKLVAMSGLVLGGAIWNMKETTN